MALTTVASLKAYALSNATAQADTSRDTEMTAAIGRVSIALPRMLGRVLEKADFVRYYAGDDWRDVIALHPGHRPVIHTPATDPIVVVAVEENGAALSVAEGYDPSAGIILIDCNIDKPCYLQKQGACFSPGISNIKVSYTAGPETVSADVEHLANWMSWFAYTEPDRFAKASGAITGVGFSYTREMPTEVKAIFDALVIW